MGASFWVSRVPYQEDIEAALQQARHDAYDRGEFYRLPPEHYAKARSMDEEEYVARDMVEQRACWEGVPGMEDWEPDDSMPREFWRAAHVEVVGPDSLLDAQPHSGTHSVIDMTGVAAEPSFGMVAPMPADAIVAAFGTHQPSDTDVTRALDAYAVDDFGRWYGAYVVAYDGGQPVAVHFFGHSGD